MQTLQPRAASEKGDWEAGCLGGLLGAQMWVQPWPEGAKFKFKPRSSEPLCAFESGSMLAFE